MIVHIRGDFMKHRYTCDTHHEELKHGSLPNEEVLQKMSTLLKIAGDPTRLKMLYVLVRGPKCVCDLQETIHASQSLVSHQLKILRDNGLVKCEKIGNRALYTLSDDHVVALLSIVHEHVMEEEEL